MRPLILLGEYWVIGKSQNKHKSENITRAICKSRNAIEKSKISKITIDGVDYHNISYFQISRLTGLFPNKMFIKCKKRFSKQIRHKGTRFLTRVSCRSNHKLLWLLVPVWLERLEMREKNLVPSVQLVWIKKMSFSLWILRVRDIVFW